MTDKLREFHAPSQVRNVTLCQLKVRFLTGRRSVQFRGSHCRVHTNWFSVMISTSKTAVTWSLHSRSIQILHYSVEFSQFRHLYCSVVINDNGFVCLIFTNIIVSVMGLMWSISIHTGLFDEIIYHSIKAPKLIFCKQNEMKQIWISEPFNDETAYKSCK